MDNSERIDKFLHEQMTLEESEAFLNDLRTDKDLRDEAQSLAMLIKEMRVEQAKQDAEIIEEVLAVKKKAKIVRMTRWIGSIAAMFILIFGANYFYKLHQMNGLFNEYYTSYEYTEPRGGDGNVEKELATLFNEVGTAKDIKPVIEKLQTIYDNIDNEYEYSLYADDITWYLALAYIKDHNQDKAKDFLKHLVANGNTEAEKLLEQVKHIN